MDRCVVCGNQYEKAFRITFADRTTHVFDSFECAIQALAPKCTHCQCRIIGHGLERGGLVFCCEHCAREHADAAADEGSKLSFPASDPPAPSPAGNVRARRLQEGRIGWAVLWLLGVPLPVLLVLYLMRGCT